VGASEPEEVLELEEKEHELVTIMCEGQIEELRDGLFYSVGVQVRFSHLHDTIVILYFLCQKYPI
jgi:hypothetical protein